MDTTGIVLLCIFVPIGALILFMILRTVFTKKKDLKPKTFEPFDFNKDELAKKLSEAVQIPTVTVVNEGESYEAFDKYHKYLEKTFPNVFSNAEVNVIHEHSLVLIIKGSDESLLPAAFLAHQDVVPAPPEGWEHEPFSGDIEGGFVHGRGSQDMKHQMIANLEGCEALLKSGRRPKRTIYFCFGHDEEYTGKNGAKYIVQWLSDNNIRFEFVFDEGGTVLDPNAMINNKMKLFDGKLALIGTTEKGYVDYVLTSEIPGGHASSPTRKNSVNTLCEAVYLLSNSPMKAHWSKPVKELFKTIAPYSHPLIKFVLVNRDILSPILKPLMLKAPVGASALRTTFAFTQLKGSDAPNVIPPRAEAVINCRINIGENQEQVEEYMQKVVGKDIKISKLHAGFDPSPVSNIKSKPYELITRSITEVFPDFIPAPYPFIAATDSKYYYKVCDNVFRFTPFEVTPKDQHRIHGLNERCDIDALVLAAKFFARLMENTCF